MVNNSLTFLRFGMFFFIATMLYCIAGMNCLLLMLPFLISYAPSGGCTFVNQNIKLREKAAYKAQLCVFNVAVSVPVIFS